MRGIANGIVQRAGALIKGGFGSLADALFPACCEVCGRELVDGENLLCLHCRHEMPRTFYHRCADSPLHERLALPGVPIERTASYFHYVRGNPFARLIQQSKYNSRPAIDRRLAADFARELAADGFFEGIDMLQPVPLHWLRRFRRGYNQAEIICRGISEVTGIPIADNLRARRHSTQTRKSIAERQANLRGVMKLISGHEIAGKHVLIVDDVITTGATMLSAARALLTASPRPEISILALASTVN